MSFLQKAFINIHPLLQLAMIICVSGTALIFGAVVSMIIFEDSPLIANAVGLILGMGSGAFTYTKLMSRGKGIGFNSENITNNLVLFFLGTIGIVYLFSPIMDLSYRLNKWLLVEGSDIYNIVELLETESLRITKEFLVMDNPSEFFVALICIAVVPAIFEEYLFRGALQPLFAKWTGNIHAGIWISAFLFSFVHFQFFGLIPRMLLGALFGYLLIWSGSIYTAILGHFINNASAVVAAYVLGSDWIDENMDPTHLPEPGIFEYSSAFIFSLIIAVIAFFMNRASVWPENKAIYLERERSQDHLSL
jgi:membrane protease YdiL (CAAX protease family)